MTKDETLFIETALNKKTEIVEIGSWTEDWDPSLTFAVPSHRKSSHEAVLWLYRPATSDLVRWTIPCGRESKAVRDSLAASFGQNDLPYGYPSLDAYTKYAMVPHSIQPLTKSAILVSHQGLNPFVLDTRRHVFQSVGKNSEPLEFFYAATPAVSQDRKSVYTARWKIEYTARLDDRSVFSEIVCIDAEGNERIVQTVPFADVHQLSLSNDGRYLVTTEFGLLLNGSPPPIRETSRKRQWEALKEIGLKPSRMAVMDLEKGDFTLWQAPWPSSAHIVFDPDEPGVFYLSCHNLGIVGGRLVYFGPGKLLRMKIETGLPSIDKTYTHGAFYRITTHDIVRMDGKKAVAVTLYPNACEIVDADSFIGIDSFNLFEIAGLQDERIKYPNIGGLYPFSVAQGGKEDTLFLNGSQCLYVVKNNGKQRTARSSDFNRDPDIMVLGHTSRYLENLIAG